MAAEEPGVSKKPATLREYRNWLKEIHGLDLSDRIRSHYEAVTSRLERTFTESSLWASLEAELKRSHEEYLVATGYPLLRFFSPPSLLIKPFDSFVLKTFRKNILENANWPEPPPGNWLLFPDWFSRVNDVLRCRFEVKYLDGVQFIAGRLARLGEGAGFAMTVRFEARAEGYYAAHIDARRDFDIPRLTWDTERREMSVELQITTQLQEVILQLTHKFYEERRRGGPPRDLAWQWDYSSEQFVGNYLGHILHYVEGMIMEVRDRQGRE